MTGAHVHLMLTHIPVVGIGFGVLILAYALLSKRMESARVAMGVFVLSGLAAVAVYLTGESAEELVEGLPGVTHAAIERHEAAAVALAGALVLRASALLGLVLNRKGFARRANGGVLAVALIVVVLMAWTATLGGRINHPEIRSDQAVVSTAAEPEEGEHDD